MAAFKRGVQHDGTWYVVAGDSNRERVEFVAGGLPWDITGAVIAAEARASVTAPGPPALTAVVEMTDPPAGVAHISWDGEAVRAVLAGDAEWSGVYDIEIMQGGEVSTPWQRPMRALMDVTREDL